jgi:hypothetical protein
MTETKEVTRNVTAYDAERLGMRKLAAYRRRIETAALLAERAAKENLQKR